MFDAGLIDFDVSVCFTVRKLSGDMSDLLWLNDPQMARLKPFFLKSHGKLRVDDRYRQASKVSES